MIYFLIVVSVGGTSSRSPGRSPAALLLGIADVAGKYYHSEDRVAFTVYTAHDPDPACWRPQGLFTREGRPLT